MQYPFFSANAPAVRSRASFPQWGRWFKARATCAHCNALNGLIQSFREIEREIIALSRAGISVEWKDVGHPSASGNAGKRSGPAPFQNATGAEKS